MTTWLRRAAVLAALVIATAVFTTNTSARVGYKVQHHGGMAITVGELRAILAQYPEEMIVTRPLDEDAVKGLYEWELRCVEVMREPLYFVTPRANCTGPTVLVIE